MDPVIRISHLVISKTVWLDALLSCVHRLAGMEENKTCMKSANIFYLAGHYDFCYPKKYAYAHVAGYTDTGVHGNRHS
jgi:hypothetical protein